jgi:hypothetical protein
MRLQLCDERTIQGVFNRLRIWERYQEGELAMEVKSTGGWKRKNPRRGERWEIWRFYDPRTNRTLAITKLHVKRSNKEITGSGKPDPQRVCDRGTLYELRKVPPLAELDRR